MLKILVYACDVCLREWKYENAPAFGRRDKIYPLIRVDRSEICANCLRRGLELLGNEK